MELKIKHYIITSPIKDILEKLKSAVQWKCFDKIIDKGDNIVVTCPNRDHSNGRESHPSCSIYNRRDSDDVPYGWVRCFSCGYSKSLPEMVGDLFENDEEFGERWLLSNCESIYVDEVELLPSIDIDKKVTSTSQYLDEGVLDQYKFYHPYMKTRKLADDVIKRFQIGYDCINQCLTFPVRDLKGNLVMITKRSVNSKYFFIPKAVEKPVYLLNDIVKNNYKTAMITEGQIDALTAYSYGFPCCATMGNPSSSQIDILNRCGINTFILAFDNDSSGKRFTMELQRKLRKDILLTNFPIPSGYKDLNDLDKATFNRILNNLGIVWRIS